MNNFNKASIFGCAAISKDKVADITIQSALVSIKTGELNINGSVIDIARLVSEARICGKPSEGYTNYKKYRLPAITWGSEFQSARNCKDGFTFSGCQYFDIDGLGEGTDLEAIKVQILAIPCVKAIWVSMSGKGLGGIIYTESADSGHLAQFSVTISELGYTVDPSVKDTASRLNTLSFDPAILIKSEVSVIPLVEKKVKPDYSLLVPKKSETNEPVNGSLAHRIAYKYTSRKTSFTEGNHCAFVTAYAGMMNQFGVDFNEMSSELSKQVGHFNTERAQDIYNRYAFQFNTKSEKPVAYKTVSKVTNVLKEGQYLSDILTKEDVIGKMLIAPTGSGKSNLIANFSGKKVMIVPTQPLSDEFAKSYKGVSFNQYNKEVSNNNSLIFVTYASYSNLLTYIDIAQYDVIADECHSFVTASDRTFMLKDLSKVLKALENGKQKSTTLLTATPVRSCNAYLQSFATIKVTREVEKTKKLFIVKTADTNKLVKDVFTKAKANNSFVSVLFNNTGSRLDKLTSTLEDFNVQTFSSAQKTEEHFTELITTGVFNDKTDGIISTTVLGSGNSFKVGDNRNKIVYVVVIGKFSAAVIEQFAARVRDSKEVHVIVARNEDYINDVEFYFDAYKSEYGYNQLANLNVTFYNKQRELSSEFSIDVTSAVNPIQETFVTFNGSEYEIDDLVISNAIHNDETTATYKNADFFSEKMSEYGYKFAGIIAHTQVLDSTEKAAIKVSTDAKRATKEANALVIINTIKAEGLVENQIKVEKNEKMSAEESTIRFRLNYIYRHEQDEAKVFDIYTQVTSSTQAWTVFEKQILVQKIATDSSIKERQDKKLVEAIYKEFKVRESLTSDQLNKRMNKVLGSLLNGFKSISKTKSAQLIKWFFGANEVVAKVDKVTVRSLVLTTSNPCPVKIDSDSYIAHKNEMKALYDRVNDISLLEIFAL